MNKQDKQFYNKVVSEIEALKVMKVDSSPITKEELQAIRILKGIRLSIWLLG